MKKEFTLVFFSLGRSCLMLAVIGTHDPKKKRRGDGEEEIMAGMVHREGFCVGSLYAIIFRLPGQMIEMKLI